MSMGRRNREEQGVLFVAATREHGPANVFYERLNDLLDQIGFDRQVDGLCEPLFKKGGRPSVPPGCFFRLLFIGYFEGLASDRAIAWRSADSRSLERFVGIPDGKATPHHDTISATRHLYSGQVYEAVFELVLKAACDDGLLKGRQLGVDASLVEANASLRNVEHKVSGEDWLEYIKRLGAEERLEQAQADAVERGDQPPTSPPPPAPGMSDREDAVRRDRKRNKKGKKRFSNEHWTSCSDPDARIAKMKDGRTHMAYKVENAIDLESEIIVAAEVYHGSEGDTSTGGETAIRGRVAMMRVGVERETIEVALDTGYHSGWFLWSMEQAGLRPYIPEKLNMTPIREGSARWPYREEIRNNRRRVKRAKGKRLQRLRSEKVERRFANLLDNGGQRKMTHRGLEPVGYRYKMAAAASNLGVMMRARFGAGTPRQLADMMQRAFLRLYGRIVALRRTWLPWYDSDRASRASNWLGSAIPLKLQPNIPTAEIRGLPTDC